MDEKLYRVVWNDGCNFSVPLPLKEAQIMRDNACLMWGEVFHIEEAE